MNELISLDRKNIWHPFTPLETSAPIPLITKASGIYLHTSDGRQIVDAISSWWVNLHGHANETIARAIADQAAKLEHVIFAGFTHEPAIRLSQNLVSILPESYSRIFFSDNGSTAVEVALKMAIQYWHNRGTPKQKVIAIKGAYHGDTFGSMSVADRGLFNEPFFPFLFDTSFIDFPVPGEEKKTLDQFRELAKDGDVAAFIFEPLVQAAGGMRMYSASILGQLLAYAKSKDVVCIADEVFTGFGRTGTTLAVDQVDQKPDIIALSKGITGGFMPLGVTACSTEISEAFNSPSLSRTFFHGHSYTANPLACAAANASFDLLMGEECQRNIAVITRMQEEFAHTMTGHSRVADARSLGTILAIEIKTEQESKYENSLRTTIYDHFLSHDILLRPLGNVVYILPPYVMTSEELGHIHNIIREFVG